MSEIVKMDEMAAIRLPMDSFMLCTEEFINVRDYAKASKKTVASILKVFYNWIRERPTGTAIEYRDYLAVDRKKSKNYIQTTFSVLRLFFDFLMDKQITTFNPFRTVVIRKGASEFDQSRILSDEEVTAIVNALDHVTPRAAALAAIMLNTGLRCQALVNAKMEHIDHKMDVPRLFVKHKGHSKEDAYVWLNPMALHYLKKWLRVRPLTKSNALFICYKYPFEKISYFVIRKDMNSIFEMCNIKDRTPHCFRHTAITLARRAGATMLDVKMMAGHVDIRTTEIYDHSARRITHAPELAIYNVLRRNEYESGT